MDSGGCPPRVTPAVFPLGCLPLQTTRVTLLWFIAQIPQSPLVLGCPQSRSFPELGQNPLSDWRAFGPGPPPAVLT